MDSSTHSEVLDIRSFSVGSLCGWISLPWCPVSELKALLPLQALPVRALLTPVGPPFSLLITRPSAVSTSSRKISPQMGPFSGTAAVFGNHLSQLLCSSTISLHPYSQAMPVLWSGQNHWNWRDWEQAQQHLHTNSRLRPWLCCGEVWANREGRRPKNSWGSKIFRWSGVVHESVCTYLCCVHYHGIWASYECNSVQIVWYK